MLKDQGLYMRHALSLWQQQQQGGGGGLGPRRHALSLWQQQGGHTPRCEASGE